MGPSVARRRRAVRARRPAVSRPAPVIRDGRPVSARADIPAKPWRPAHRASMAVLLCPGRRAGGVVRSGFGVKGDEATYVAMALSAAYDGDLAYERRDLERFYQIYRGGPEGIFLKRGGQARLEVGGEWPFVSVRSRPTAGADRVSFGRG